MHVPSRAIVLSNAAVELVAATGRPVDARGCNKIERRDRGRTSVVLAGNIGGAQVVGIASVRVYVMVVTRLQLGLQVGCADWDEQLGGWQLDQAQGGV